MFDDATSTWQTTPGVISKGPPSSLPGNRKSFPLRRLVGLHYHLARSLSHEGRTDEAMDHLLFAAENGGGTWYVSAAKKQLENM